jgi:hypothetical protein
MNRTTEERTPTMIRASSTGLISEPNGKLKDGKTRHRCGQQEDRRRIRREAQEIGEIHKRKSAEYASYTQHVEWMHKDVVLSLEHNPCLKL